jgi:hypothetical protein
VAFIRVDVWDPSAEGPWIVERLRQEGFEVRSVALADTVLTRADLVLIAGDADGALAALKLLRDEGMHGAVPVILIGVPDGMDHHGEGPAFGADAVLARPIEFGPLLSCAHRLLKRRHSESSELPRGAAPVERTQRLASSESEPDSSQVFEVRTPPESIESWRPREPTLELDRGAPSRESRPSSSVRSASSIPARPSTSPSRTPPPTGPGSRPGTGPFGTDAPEPVIPPEARAELSPWLAELLHAADRRVFPDHPALALHFPAANEPPEVLIPQELFEASSFRIDEPVVEDPIDAFTYVGGPAVPSPRESAAPVPPSDAPRSLRERPTSPETPNKIQRAEPPSAGTWDGEEDEERSATGSRADAAEIQPVRSLDESLGPVGDDGVRRGVLEPAGLLRVAWAIAGAQLDCAVALECEGGLALDLTFSSGELRGIEGPIAQRALESLRRRGRASESPPGEAAARAALDRRVELGELSRYERDRALREAREDVFADAIASPRSSHAIRALEETEPGRTRSRTRALSRPIRAALVSAARRALGSDQVRSLLGPRALGIALGPEREVALELAEIDAELIDLLLRMEGRSLAEIEAAAPTEPGLAGAIYALIAGGALVPCEPPAGAEPPPEARAAVRALIENAARAARESDYFAILGVARSARDAEIERAHGARRDELSALPLGVLGLTPLEAARADAIAALDEAYRALRDAERRARYAAALAR